MTGLLTTKIESEDGNTLEECDRQTLEVINSIKYVLFLFNLTCGERRFTLFPRSVRLAGDVIKSMYRL